MTIDQTRGAGRYIVDRGWSLQIGSVRVAGWNRCYTGGPAAPGTEAMPSRLPVRTNIGVGLFCLCTLAITALVGERVRASQPYTVMIPVPPATARNAPRHPDHAPAARSRHAAPPSAAVRHDAAVAPPTTRAPLDLSLDADAADGGEAIASSRAAAVKTALLSGDMQEWRDAAGGHGFVVAGPLQQEEDGRCRALAVMIRSTDGDTVEQRRECLR
jgi:hypothetical protein